MLAHHDTGSQAGTRRSGQGDFAFFAGRFNTFNVAKNIGIRQIAELAGWIDVINDAGYLAFESYLAVFLT